MILEIDTSTWTRMEEVEAYAWHNNTTVSDAIRLLVNHALSTPNPTRESWKDSVHAGAEALEAAVPSLREDFTKRGLRKLAKIVLLAS